MLKALIEVEIDPIPEDGPDYDAWFKRNEEVLATEEDGYVQAGMVLAVQYVPIRGEDCVIYIDGAPAEFGLMSELTLIDS